MPTPAPNRLDDMRTLRAATVDVAFATAFATLVSGTFLIGYIKSIGGGDFWVGLVSSIPSLIGLLQIPGALWGRRFASYKPYVQLNGSFWRLYYVPLLFLPLFPQLGEKALVLVVACQAMAAAHGSLGDPIYNDWLAEMIPTKSRGWFYGRRNAIASVVGALVGLAGGVILDQFRHRGAERIGFSVVYGFGLLCAAISMFFFLRMKDRPRENPERVNFGAAIRAMSRPFRDTRFQKVLVFLFAFVFGQMFMGGLLSAFALESLHLPYTLLQTLGLVQAFTMLVAARFWGILAERYGNKPVLAILCIGLATAPVAWFFTIPDRAAHNMLVLVPGHLVAGFVWSGVGAIQFSLIMRMAPDESRANYIAGGQALIAMTAGIAPLLGAKLMANLRDQMPVFDAYLWVLGACCLFRILSVCFILPVREEGSAPIAQTLQQLRRASPTGFRAMQRLASGESVEEKEQAIASVADRNFSMATDEVIKLLHDPTPSLRREAARALAKLGDERAVEALVHQLEDHPDLVEDETIEALGELGYREAVPTLTRVLENPRPQLRRSAARALGRIGGAEAEEALLKAVTTQTEDADLVRASLQALRILGASRAGEAITRYCLDPRPSVRIAAAEAVSELRVAEAAENLRRSINEFHDEAASECVYALGAVGELDDVPLMLRAANECVSIITRRRCLLGIARLYGVEQEAYRLILLDGMARDQALLNLTIPGRGGNRLQEALTLFSQRKESEALARLAEPGAPQTIKLLKDPVVEESFLIAALEYRRWRATVTRRASESKSKH